MAFKKGHKPWNKGIPRTDEEKKHISKSKIGKPSSKKGKPGLKGKYSGNWKGGITSLNHSIRTSIKYSNWRVNVFQRDLFICQSCKKHSEGDLNAHHIKSFSLIMKENNITTLDEALNCPELWDLSNGITLCEECHSMTDNYKKK